MDPESIAHAARLILEGRLVAFPTETVYGLGANALDAAAVRRIFAAKGRPSTSPLIVHADSEAMARTLVTEWPETAAALAASYWPGPLTLVLPKRDCVPDEVTAGLATVGIRVPAHPVALALIRAAGVPIAAPSANRFTELSPVTADHVRRSLGDAVDLILDGGVPDVGIESTVISLAGEPTLLRPGTIARPQLEAITGPLRVAGSTTGAAPSPGMHHRHYRPRTPLFLGSAPTSGRGVWLWIATPREPGVRMPDNAAGYAAALYATLHELDAAGYDWIAVEAPPQSPEWAGVRDRLTRAASSF